MDEFKVTQNHETNTVINVRSSFFNLTLTRTILAEQYALSYSCKELPVINSVSEVWCNSPLSSFNTKPIIKAVIKKIMLFKGDYTF